MMSQTMYVFAGIYANVSCVCAMLQCHSEKKCALVFSLPFHHDQMRVLQQLTMMMMTMTQLLLSSKAKAVSKLMQSVSVDPLAVSVLGNMNSLHSDARFHQDRDEPIA